jgi:hypothetical protein
MHWQDAVLVLAGVLGACVAVVHGILTQRLMVRPLQELFLASQRISSPIRRLVPLLLHFSTFSWFLGGLALMAAAIWLGPEARLMTSMLVGGLYLYGALSNLWGTRGRHPGGMLMAAAVILIALGAYKPGG